MIFKLKPNSNPYESQDSITGYQHLVRNYVNPYHPSQSDSSIPLVSKPSFVDQCLNELSVSTLSSISQIISSVQNGSEEDLLDKFNLPNLKPIVDHAILADFPEVAQVEPVSKLTDADLQSLSTLGVSVDFLKSLVDDDVAMEDLHQPENSQTASKLLDNNAEIIQTLSRKQFERYDHEPRPDEQNLAKSLLTQLVSLAGDFTPNNFASSSINIFAQSRELMKRQLSAGS